MRTRGGRTSPTCATTRVSSSRLPPTPATEESAYAYTTVTCEREGDWELALGIDGIAEAWVNGSRVSARSQPFVFSDDELRIPVRLKAGNNDILLRLIRTERPWRLRRCAWSRREPSLDPSEEITPFVVPGASLEILAVRTDIEDEAGAAPVLVDVLAAGGRVAGRAEGARGERWSYFSDRGLARMARAHGAALHDKNGVGAVSGSRTPRGTRATLWPPREGSTRRQRRPGRTRWANTYACWRSWCALRLVGPLFDAATPGMWPRIHPTLLEYEELEQLRAGGPGPVHAGGFVRLAYIDPVDGSAQFCRVYLPPDYDPARRWPAVIFLHGYNGSNPPYINYGDAGR